MNNARISRILTQSSATLIDPENRPYSYGVASMNPAPIVQNTAAWLTFTYASFALSVAMMALGVWALPADLWVKGYLTMATVSVLGSTFTLAKTVRDEHEAKRFANRLDDAKAERLLMEVGRTS
jgi:hypothetical protein